MWPLVQSHDACTFHPIQAVTAEDGIGLQNRVPQVKQEFLDHRRVDTQVHGVRAGAAAGISQKSLQQRGLSGQVRGTECEHMAGASIVVTEPHGLAVVAKEQ